MSPPKLVKIKKEKAEKSAARRARPADVVEVSLVEAPADSPPTPPRRRPSTPAEVEDEVEHSSQDVSESPEEADQDDDGTQPPKKAKKVYRVAHKNIENYDFTEDQVQQLVEFVKANPAIYDKRNKEYSNNANKTDLWRECAAQFPGCEWLQCRKYFEKKRTAFGKIEAKEQKSGAAKKPRTRREDEIMSTWYFLGGHIAHAHTQSSARFSSTSSSELSAHSIERRAAEEKTKKRKRSETPTETPRSTHTTTELEECQTRESAILATLLEKVSNIGPAENSILGRFINKYTGMIECQLHEMKDNRPLLDQCMSEVQTVITKYVLRAHNPQPQVMTAPVQPLQSPTPVPVQSPVPVQAPVPVPLQSPPAVPPQQLQLQQPSAQNQWRGITPIYQNVIHYPNQPASTSAYQPQGLAYQHSNDSMSSISSIPSISTTGISQFLPSSSSPIPNFPSVSSVLNTPRQPEEEN